MSSEDGKGFTRNRERLIMELKPGDVFATQNPQGLGKIITCIEALKAQDNEAEYSHTGIIQNSEGKTLEAVMHIAEQNIFTAYKGKRVFIARWKGMTPEAYQKGWDAVKGEIGRRYPFQRLIWQLLGIAKWVHVFKTPVCSELTAMFLINAGAVTLEGKNCWGVNPQELQDEWAQSKYFDIIFEGVL